MNFKSGFLALGHDIDPAQRGDGGRGASGTGAALNAVARAVAGSGKNETLKRLALKFAGIPKTVT